jgi:MGT family glycosyltransferase
MSRFLFVVPPLTGHTNPAAGVAAALAGRGHEVAFVAHDAVVGHLLPSAATRFPAGDEFLHEVVDSLAERDTVRGAGALQFLWERWLGPLTRTMVPHVRAAVDAFGPDVVVADQQAHAGGIVAAERKLPWATSATTSAELVDPLALVPKISEWIDARLAETFAAVGLADWAREGLDPRFSPHLVLVYSTEELVGPIDRDPGSLAWVGPVLDRPADPPAFPWEWLDRHPRHVLVSLGTVNTTIGHRFLATAVEAATGRDEGIVLVAPPGDFPDPPANVLVRASIPQLDLLGRLDAVVCHAGHNTVCEALAHGVPLIVAPIRDDQPIIADQVVRSGAGVRLRFARSRPADVTGALDAVLHDGTHRDAAARIAASFRAAGGVGAAADRVAALAGA